MWLDRLLQMIFPVRYDTGEGAFPKPLSAKEEKECLKRMQEGDLSARKILIERNLRLVAHIARKYNSSAAGWEPDDLISVGSIGLIKGIDSFDAEKNAKLSTYLARCVENEILMLLRADKKKQMEVSLQEPIGHDKEGNSILLDDVLEYEDESVLEQVNIAMGLERLNAGVERVLGTREKEIVRKRYGLGGSIPLTQKQVAEKLGISRSYVYNIG